VSKAYVTEIHRHSLERAYGTLTVNAVDVGNNPQSTFTLVVFPEDQRLTNGRSRLPFRIESNDRVYLDKHSVTALMMPGRYAVVAVETLEDHDRRVDRVVRDEELLARLKPLATPLAIQPGKSKAITLTISTP